jgi:hypothetical protein
MADEAKPTNKLNVAAIFAVAAAGALFVYTAVVALQAYYLKTVAAEEERKAAQGIDSEFRSLRAAQLAEISEYRWLDQEKRTVTVPIDLAMELVTRDAAANAPSLVPAAVPAHSVPTVPAPTPTEVSPEPPTATEPEETGAP